MLHPIYHKKNELFEIKFYENEECIKPFDILTTNARHLYIELKNGGITPLIQLDADPSHIKVYTGYCPIMGLAITLNDITPNLSKYIPQNNTIFFGSDKNFFENNEKEFDMYADYFLKCPRLAINILYRFFKYKEKNQLKQCTIEKLKKLTIFFPHGTESEFQEVNNITKELKEKYGVEEINLFVLHCFNYVYRNSMGSIFTRYYDGEKNHEPITLININKIITTNSTGILKPQNTEHLQVIDCKEIFEEYLRNN